MTIYAVGDIHGYPDKLDRALKLIEADGGQHAQIVFVGDYIDRGPDSRAVIERLIEGLEEGRPWTCLKGNHDRIMEWFLEDQPRQDPHLLVGFHWFHEMIGGLPTMASYGVDVSERERLFLVHARAREAVPQSHIDFLRSLKLTHQQDDYLFVHAGIRPGIPIEAQDERDLVWIRDEFLNYRRPFPKLVVHGHTPVDSPAHLGNRVNLDGGAAFGRPLVPVALEGKKAYALTDKGRAELKPLGSRL
ncbi:MAG: metallophosphoesterase family protein [Pseudomonadota bacterium]